MDKEAGRVYLFGPFRLDPMERLLVRDGETIPLTGKAFDTLLLLVQNSGHALEKDELLKAVWPDTFVEEGNLTQNIWLVRKALGDETTAPRYIETVPKRGYRFVAAVTETNADAGRPPARRRFIWLSAVSPLWTATRRLVSWRTLVTVAASVAVGIAVGALLLRRQGPDLSAYRYTPLVTNHRWQRQPALSPDGKTLAYTAEVGGLAQLFIRGLDSPTPMQMTSLPQDAILPFWSSDARRVFFVTGPPFELWSVAAAGGAAEPFLPDVFRATLASDDRILAILRTDGSVWISSPPGSTPRPYEPAPFEARGFFDVPAIRSSPDGRKILLMINPTGRQQEYWLLPLPPGPSHRVLRSVPNLQTAPFTWMPDSRHIVMALLTRPDVPRRLVMADTSGDAWWPITTGMTDEGWMAVSSDGLKLIYTAGSHDYDLVEAPVTGGPARDLLTTSQWEGMPAWAPINQQFVFTTKRRGAEEIWIKSRQEGWERPVVTSRDFPDDATKIFMGPIFSPDGQRIAYTRVSAAGAFLWISPLAGGAPTRVTSGPSMEWPPTWSPDGAWLAFTRSATDKTELVKVKLGSVDDPMVLAEFDDDYVPQWSPTGEWITCPLPAGFGIVSPDGKTSRVLYKKDCPFTFWSKDGGTLYGVTRNGSHAVLKAVSVAGGEERIVGDLGQDLPASWAVPSIRLSLAPDGKTFAYAVVRQRWDLWMLEGFEAPPGPLGRLLRRLGLKK